ncbi:MAG: MoaD/ThiS family protein [Hyphomonadaceae bacterium]
MSGSILLFGKLRDAFQAPQIPLPDDVRTVSALRAKLIGMYPDLAAMLEPKAMRVAVNQAIVADEAGTSVSGEDEIALLPPLSGG